MNKLYRTVVSVSLFLGGLACPAQSSAIPFRQIERDAQQSVYLQIPSDEASIKLVTETLPTLGATSTFTLSRPTYKKSRVLDSKYFVLNGLHLSLAALDIGLTQHCIAKQHCREGNPLMPSSLAGQVSVISVLFGASAFVSYQLKNEDSKLWWFSPAVGIGGHAVGAVTGVIHR